MNIFVTNKNPMFAATGHCDVHLRKMIVETAQLLATAHYELDGEVVAYKPTHNNHPCAIWVRSHPANFYWAVSLLRFMLCEYKLRFNKEHKTGTHFIELAKKPTGFSRKIYTRNATPLNYVQAMPDKYKSNSVETSYQNYLNDKFKEWLSRERPMKVEWTNRERPSWVSL